MNVKFVRRDLVMGGAARRVDLKKSIELENFYACPALKRGE